MMVRMFNPKILQEAYSLAKLQEALKNRPTMFVQGNETIYGRAQGGLMGLQGAKTNIAVNNTANMGNAKKLNQVGLVKKPLNLTPKQIEEKKAKNLCFWCEDRFTLGHKCKNRQLYMITILDDKNDVVKDEVELRVHDDEAREFVEEQPQLSLNALEGTYNYQTMRLKRSVE